MAIAPRTRVRVNMVGYIVLGLLLSYLMATQVLSVLQDRYSVYAHFPDAGGVFTNQEVTYRGITVGQVGDMELTRDGVRLELLIKEGTEIPKNDIEARVMFKSAVGEQFVDLLPRSSGEPFLADGDEIPVEQTDIPVSTQALLSTLEAVLRGVPPEALKGAVDSLGEGLAGRGSDLATILEATADLSELFAERAPEVEGILQEGTKVGGAFLESRRDFARAIHELVTVSESLAGSTADLDRLMQGSNLSSDELVALIRENRAELNQFLIEFGEVNALQADHADDLAKLFRFLPSALANLESTFERDTGLIRFGLVSDEHEEPEACSYGTERRKPENRKFRLPPKNARCKRSSGDSSRAITSKDIQQLLGGSGSEEPAEEFDPSLIPGLDISGIGGPGLPSRMSDWSWTLLMLNGI